MITNENETWDTGYLLDTVTAHAEYTVTQAQLYTDPMLHDYLVQALPPYPTNSDGSLAWSPGAPAAYFHYTDTNHLGAVGGRIKYCIQLNDCPLHQSWRVRWEEVTAFDDTNVPDQFKHFKIVMTGNGDPTNGPEVTNNIPVPTVPCSITVQNLRKTPITSPSPPGY